MSTRRDLGPPRTYVRVHDGDSEEVPDVRQHGALTWKSIALTAVMTLLTGAAGIIGSHMGLATKDDLATAVKSLATKDEVATMIKTLVAKESDDMKTYVDGKVESGRQTSVHVARRKHQPVSDDQQ